MYAVCSEVVLKVVSEVVVKPPHELVDKPLLRGLSIGKDGRSDAGSCVFLIWKAEILQRLLLCWSIHLLQKLQHLGFCTQSPLYFIHALEEDSSMAKNHGGRVVGE